MVERFQGGLCNILIFIKSILLAAIISFILLLARAFESRTMPALRVWHTVSLSEEFTARDATPQSTLQDYLDREKRLFQELKEKVYDQVAPTKDMTYCRYYAGGPQDSESLGRNWNRTFELVPEKVKGGALTVKYALDAMSGPGLPLPDRLFLFSPEIGITPLASISTVDRILSFLPYFAKFKWLSIEPEYDPYKYNSFPKNAGQQAYEITVALLEQLKDTREAGRFAAFPPVLTFLSWIDATVETSATIHRFYDKLENEGSELVVFDVNRFDRLAPFLPSGDDKALKHLQTRSDLPYRLTVIANVAPDSELVLRQTQAPRSSSLDPAPLSMSWPSGVYSLAHVAIPFPPDDPVYGGKTDPRTKYRGLPLGRLQPRCETGLLTVSVGQLMRLRHNPF